MKLDDIAAVQVSTYYGEETTLQVEMKIHFHEKKFYINGSYRLPWYGKYHELDASEIERLLLVIQDCDLLGWDSAYFVPVIHGHSWGLVITYRDGTEMLKCGFNMYPRKWHEFYDAMCLASERIRVRTTSKEPEP